MNTEASQAKCPHCGLPAGKLIKHRRGTPYEVVNAGFCPHCGREWYDGTASAYPLKPIKETEQ